MHKKRFDLILTFTLLLVWPRILGRVADGFIDIDDPQSLIDIGISCPLVDPGADESKTGSLLERDQEPNVIDWCWRQIKRFVEMEDTPMFRNMLCSSHPQGQALQSGRNLKS